MLRLVSRIAAAPLRSSVAIRKISSTAAMAAAAGGAGGAAAPAAAGFRVESDTMGKLNVRNDVYWGAQTQRSLENFKIGGPQAKMPIEIIRGECRL